MPVSRLKRPYDTLRPTQKHEQKTQLRSAVAEAEQKIGCPLGAIASPSTLSPADLIHLPTSIREQIRTVPSLHIPSEQSMIQCKKQLANTLIELILLYSLSNLSASSQLHSTSSSASVIASYSVHSQNYFQKN